MNELTFLAVAALILAAHLWCEHGGRVWPALVTKAHVSLLFVAAALFEPHGVPAYSGMVIAGLVLSLAGDVLLAIPGEKSFLAGLVSFLLGHVCYVIAFFTLGTPGLAAAGSAAALVLVALPVFRWLAPHLGEMRGPVMAYMTVISVMVIAAVGVMERGDLPLRGRMLVLAGALAFYLSDLFVARDRFVDNAFVNRLVGLPLYFGAQFMLAFSLGMFS